MIENLPSLSNHFLVAMPDQVGPPFERSVIYLCEHDSHGAMGFILNYPLQLTWHDLLLSMETEATSNKEALRKRAVLFGGPCQQEHVFTLHPSSQQWKSTTNFGETISITTSSDILKALSQNALPNDILVFLGYASWDAGQLEEEIANNDWLHAPIDSQIIFELPFEVRWNAAINLLGVDPKQFITKPGHA